MERILFGGTHSSVGKTTVVAGILAALAKRGRLLAPFKVGPDYIDPGFHSAAAGVTAGNLDSWMIPPDQVLEVMERRVPQGALAVIEGVMGLYDGRIGQGEQGSTAHVAKITQTPVILVASGAKMARSVAALVGGYLKFDPAVRFAGVVFNRVSGEKHYRLLKDAVEEYLEVPVLGYLPVDAGLTVPERYLGLVPAAEMPGVQELLDRLAQAAEETMDIDAIEAAARDAGELPAPSGRLYPPENKKPTCRIAVARDEAFHFYYRENLELLASHGAEIVTFSPLHDRRLPESTAGVYLGGGFPERFAAKLSGNRAMLESLKAAASAGMPVYAECGGYMYLARELVDEKGNSYPMAAVFPGRARMRSRRRALGYAEVVARRDLFFLPRGETARGHEFHWSEMELVEEDGQGIFEKRPRGEVCGQVTGNCVGSYIHLHFLSNPQIAPRFVRVCRQYAKGSCNDVV